VNGIRTEFEFVLPKGYLDEAGTLHREGTMRLATAADEILPHRDPRVHNNPAYLPVIVMSRVVTRLGTLEAINPPVIERLFAADLGYLQDFYNRINGAESRRMSVSCPHCQGSFEVEPELAGE
jgi:hypothetical protein